jgi:hypothetical protein
MADYVTLTGRRGRPTSYRIEHIQQIVDQAEDKSHIHLIANQNPVEVAHSRKEILSAIQDAKIANGEDF